MDNQERRKYLGGSDAAAALGLSRWTSPLKLWAIKTGQIVEEESDAIHLRLGKKLEDTVAEFFTEDTGKKVRRVKETLFHAKHGFLAANIDRRVVGEDAILECKTASAWKAKEWSGEEIPQEYIIQVMHYLAVTGAQKAYIAVLIGNQDFKWKIVDRDEAVIAQMVQKEVDFWQKFVVPKVMPMHVTADDAPTLYELFPLAHPGEVITLDDEANRLIESRNSLTQDKIALEGQIEQIENEIRLRLKEAEAGESALWYVTWKNQSQRRIDTERLKKEVPHIYDEYAKTVNFRKLTIKARKGN